MHRIAPRPPRQTGPAMPRGEFLLEPPPDLAETGTGGIGQYLFYLPMIGGAGAMVFMFAGPGATAITYVASAMYGLSSFGMVLSQFGRAGGDRARKMDGDRRDYLRYLAQARKRIRDAARAQRDAQVWNHPDPQTLWGFAMSSRRWERRPSDPDFGEMRVASGPQRLALRLVPPETKPIEDLDPVCAGALRRFVGAQHTVAGLPNAVAARNYARISLESDDRSQARALVRAMLAQAATFHSPQELCIAVCAGQEQLAEWEWVKWLPHALHPDRVDAAGPIRLVRDDLAQIEALLGEELSARPRFRPNATVDRPQLLVVVDGGRVPLGCQLAVGDALGVCVIDIGELLGRPTDQHVLRLRLHPDRIDRVAAEGVVTLGVPDALGVEQAAALAHQLAGFRLGPVGEGRAVASDHDVAALWGVGDLNALDAQLTWQPRAPRDRLRVPIGVAQDGSRTELDLKEAAQGGMGPHGLIIGATGSGKSELLRTLVSGLAVTHSPEQLNFVLADFKGGATFLGLEGLPHTSAIITNLAEELPLVDRMQDALRGELVRRQELLRSAGNYTSVLDYERARAQGAPLEPLPSMLVVVDEFTELLTQKPDFAELFVMMGRLGRSLAVHLLLASQRLEEGRLRGLETHLSYRICLRTFSANESRLVLGVPDAHLLPSEPGNAFLKYDVSGMTRFKAAYVSGPYDSFSAAPDLRTPAATQLVPYLAAEIPLTQMDSPIPTEDQPRSRVLDLVVDRLRGKGRPAHQVWLPPLAEPATLDDLLPDLHLDPVRGLCADPAWHGRLRAPVGQIDLPFEQRRAELVADLAGAAGHVAIIGAPQSGKSTLLRTLICALALTHTPAETQFYCLDFGGGALGTIADLPHVGGVASRLQPEVVRRTVAELTALLATREKRFAELGVDSMAAYRTMRARTDDPYGDVFLVIDGYSIVRGEFEPLEPAIMNLAVRGLSYGVHVVVATNRWADLRPALRDSIGTRYELRLGDPFESEISRHAAANVPAGTPGRGIIAEGLHFLAALPALRDGDVRTLVESIVGTWPGPKAPAVRLLPDVLPLASLTALAADVPGIPIGVSGEDLSPVTVEFGQEPHLVIFGDTESGKSNLLRVIANGVVSRHGPDEARLIVIDPRRTLLDVVPASHLIGYAPSAQQAESTIRDVREAMLQRLPGPDVTPEQLRGRTFWHGPELYLFVDDYDLLVTPASSPLAGLLEVLPSSRDIGLHVILARASGGAGRAQFEPVLQRLRDLGTPGVVLSGSPQEGPLVADVTPQRLPPGRGRFHRRRQGTQVIQTALAE